MDSGIVYLGGGYAHDPETVYTLELGTLRPGAPGSRGYGEYPGSGAGYKVAGVLSGPVYPGAGIPGSHASYGFCAAHV